MLPDGAGARAWAAARNGAWRSRDATRRLRSSRAGEKGAPTSARVRAAPTGGAACALAHVLRVAADETNRAAVLARPGSARARRERDRHRGHRAVGRAPAALDLRRRLGPGPEAPDAGRCRGGGAAELRRPDVPRVAARDRTARNSLAQAAHRGCAVRDRRLRAGLRSRRRAQGQALLHEGVGRDRRRLPARGPPPGRARDADPHSFADGLPRPAAGAPAQRARVPADPGRIPRAGCGGAGYRTQAARRHPRPALTSPPGLEGSLGSWGTIAETHALATAPKAVA